MNRKIFYIIAFLALHTGISFSAQQPRIGTVVSTWRTKKDNYVLRYQADSKASHNGYTEAKITNTEAQQLLDQKKYAADSLQFHLQHQDDDRIFKLIMSPDVLKELEKDRQIINKNQLNNENNAPINFSLISEISPIRTVPNSSKAPWPLLKFGIGGCALFVFVIWYFKNNITQYIS